MIKLGLIDIWALEPNRDAEVIIDALVEENRELREESEAALEGAMKRIEALTAIKEIYLGANDTLMKEVEQYKLKETILILQLQKRDEQIRELKQNSRAAKYFEIEAENLKLTQEVQRLNGIVNEVKQYLTVLNAAPSKRV